MQKLRFIFENLKGGGGGSTTAILATTSQWISVQHVYMHLHTPGALLILFHTSSNHHAPICKFSKRRAWILIKNTINTMSGLNTYQSVKIPGSLPLKTTKNGGPTVLVWSTSSLEVACWGVGMCRVGMVWGVKGNCGVEGADRWYGLRGVAGRPRCAGTCIRLPQKGVVWFAIVMCWARTWMLSRSWWDKQIKKNLPSSSSTASFVREPLWLVIFSSCSIPIIRSVYRWVIYTGFTILWHLPVKRSSLTIISPSISSDTLRDLSSIWEDSDGFRGLFISGKKGIKSYSNARPFIHVWFELVFDSA